MRQFDVKATKTINGNTYRIRPLPAFKCANLSGELANIALPILSALAPIISGASQNGSFMDVDAEDLAPRLAAGFEKLSGDRVEGLMKKLLTTYNNVSVEVDGSGEAEPLTEDLANELFCGDITGMFVLAFEVAKSNYSGFFTTLTTAYGNQLKGIMDAMILNSTSTDG
jgi:hypothetical protein